MHLFGPEDCAAGVSGLRVYHGYGRRGRGTGDIYKAPGKPVKPEHSDTFRARFVDRRVRQVQIGEHKPGSNPQPRL